MSAFFSALGGFAEGFNQSLQKNQEYAQQAKAAKEKIDADFLHQAGLMREEQRLKSANTIQEGFSRYPGSEYLIPENPGVKHDSKLNSQYILKALNGILDSVGSEQAAEIVSNPNFQAATSTHLAQAFAPERVRGEGDAIEYEVHWNPVTDFTNQHLLQFARGRGFMPTNFLDIDPEDYTFKITLDPDSMNPEHKKYKQNETLVDGLHRSGEYKKLIAKYRNAYDAQGNKVSDNHIIRLLTDIKQVKTPGNGVLAGHGASFISLWRGISKKDQIMYGRNPEVVQFFDMRNPLLSENYMRYMRAETNRRNRNQAAARMLSLLELDEFGNENPNLRRGVDYIEDTYFKIADAVALGLTQEKRTSSGDTTTIYPAKTVPLTAAMRSKLSDQVSLATASLDQITDVQNLLLTLNKLDKPGAHLPLRLENFFNTLLGASGPDVPGDSRPQIVKGIIDGLIGVGKSLFDRNQEFKDINEAAGVSSNDSTGLKVWNEDTMNDLKAIEVHVSSLYEKDKAIIDEFTKRHATLTQEEAALYWRQDLDDKERAAVQQFYLASAKAELTYKLAMTWQGGAGGRAVSDYDFKTIRAAIWSAPSPGAQDAVLEYIKMSAIRPLLRNKILLRYDQREGVNPYTVLQNVESILQVAYTRAVSPYYADGKIGGISEADMRKNHDQLFKYGAHPSPEQLGFSRFAPGKPEIPSLEELRVQ